MAKIIKCKTCGADMASNAKSCPGCGAKNKKPFYAKVWFWVLVLFVIGAAGSSSNSSSSNDAVASNTETTINTKKEEKKEKFEIVGDVTSESDQFATYISGVIKNNSGKDCSYVQVTFNMYDADGNQVGTALDNINNLEKDGTWKFKAMAIEKEATSYKLAEITGF